MKDFWMIWPLFLLMGSSTAVAKDFKRFEFSVAGGLTASGNIPLDTEDTRHLSVDVNNSHNIGAAFAIHLNELDTIEVFWQRQFTEGRLPAELAAPVSQGNPPTFVLNIDQYHMNFMHHYEIPAPRTMPYVMAGLGATTYYAGGNDQNGSKSYFSFSIGGGIKHFLTDHFGLRGEIRWSPTLVSASDSSFWCRFGGSGANCVVKLKLAVQHQMDVTGGVFYRF